MTRQTNFGGGELSPLMWGRTDSPLYARGLRRCRNFFVSQEGMAVSRPGSLFVAETKLPLKRTRLIPFIYSDTQAYVLEFGEGYIRFHAHGARIESAPGVPLEVATTYLEAELPAIRFAQVGALLTLTHPAHRVMELRATVDPLVWTLTPGQFGPPSDGLTGAPMNLVLKGADGAAKPMCMLVDNPAGSLFLVDAAHPPREWRYLLTALLRHKTSGRTAETRPVEVSRYYDGATGGSVNPLPTDRFIVLYQDKPVLIRTPDFGAAVNPLPANWDVIGMCVYRGRGSLSAGGRASLYGFVGVTDRAGDFLDIGEQPDYLTPPPQGFDPFSNVEFPVAVAFFQERRVLGGTNLREATLFPSATGDYGNHDVPALPIATQALEFELAANTRQAIRHLATMGHLIVFTDAAVWRVGGTAQEPLGPDSVEARTVDKVGCGIVPPLEVDGSLLWARNKGRGARALVLEGGEYFGSDISKHSSHLFVGGEGPFAIGTRKLLGWAYAEDPWGVVWAVREDGALLSLTYSREHHMAAWARHDSPEANGSNAFHCSVCAIPEDGEDFVYVAVLRGGTWCIERFASRVINDSPTDGCCVDSALKFEGEPTDTITGLPAHLEGRDVWFTSSGPNPPFGPLRVVGGSITLPEVPADNAIKPGSEGDPWLIGYVGIRFTPELETLDVGAGDSKLSQKATARVGVEVSSSRGLSAGQDFEHLEEWEQRDVAAGYLAPSAASDVLDIPVTSTFDKGARAAIRQTLPLPVTVLAITRVVDSGS